MCCPFCFHIGLPECSKLAGCWLAPQGRSQEQVEVETVVLALMTVPTKQDTKE